MLSGLVCSIGVLYVLLTLFTTRLYLQEVNQKLNRALARHLVTEKILMKEGRINEEALKEIFHMLMVVNPSIEVYLLDPAGAILAYSAPPGKVKRSRVSLEPLKRFLSEAATFPLLGDDPRDPDRKKVFSVSPIPVEGPPEGYLYVVLGGEEFDSAVHMVLGSYIIQLSLWTAGIGLLFALLAGLLLFSLLTRRVRQLASTVEAFARSDFSEQVPVATGVGPRSDQAPPGDEIDRLGKTFDRMVDRILQQLKKLRQTDALRRELVANVSHDLRTPLAALHGYLETLLMKEGKLTPQEQRNFLEIAVKQSERLGTLVAELFELAKLDSHETQLHCEPFALGELVQDVAQKFQLAAEKKKIRLQTHFLADLPFVFADIRLIERALENLIENSLRYTPEGGTVTVALAREGDKVTVRVADTGCGIPQQDLPYIFDRFYRVEKQQRSEGAGLGLAITKRILDLHGSSIETVSTVNVGTSIGFQLPTCTP